MYRIKNWSKYQTISKERLTPLPWFKMYRDFFNDYHVLKLSPEKRLILIALFSYCNNETGVIKSDEEQIAFLLRCEQFSFEEFIHFLELCDPSEHDDADGDNSEHRVAEGSEEESRVERGDERKKEESKKRLKKDKDTDETEDFPLLDKRAVQSVLDKTLFRNQRLEFFDIFWDLYPDKGQGSARSQALTSWMEIESDDFETLFSKIMRKLKNHVASQDWSNENGRYIPFATKWIEERRWESVNRIEVKGGYDWGDRVLYEDHDEPDTPPDPFDRLKGIFG